MVRCKQLQEVLSKRKRITVLLLAPTVGDTYQCKKHIANRKLVITLLGKPLLQSQQERAMHIQQITKVCREYRIDCILLQNCLAGLECFFQRIQENLKIQKVSANQVQRQMERESKRERERSIGHTVEMVTNTFT
jgi:hypothetical protein